MLNKDISHLNKLRKEYRKLIYRALPISVVIMLVTGLSLSYWFNQPVKTVEAVNNSITEAVVTPYYSSQLYAGTYHVLGMLKIHLKDATAGKLQTMTVKGDDSYNADLATLVLFLDGTACGVGADGKLDITTDYALPAVSGFTGNLATFDLASDGCQMRGTSGDTYFVAYVLNSNDFTDFEGNTYTAQILQDDITSSRGVKTGPSADSEIASVTINTTTAPVLQSFTSTKENGAYGKTSEIYIYANYDKVIASGSLSNMHVTLDNGVAVTLDQIAGKSIWGYYTVTNPAVPGEASVDLTIASIDTESVTDIFGQTQSASTIPVGENLGDNSAIVIDTTTVDITPPVLQSFTSTTIDGTYGWGDIINITATYDEPLADSWSGALLFVWLNNGALTTIPMNTFSGNTISATYMIGQEGNSSENVTDLSIDSIAMSNVKDRYGNTQASATIPVGQNLADNSNINVQIDAPIMGQSENIQLFDATNNGFFEKVTFEIQNPNNETWSLNGSGPYGLSVMQIGVTPIPMDIWSIIILGDAAADVVTIEIASITDSGFVQDTDGVNTNPIELIYTAGGLDNITSTGGFELNAIASGDTDSHDTEIDKAAPVIVSAEYKDIDSNGQIDSVDISFAPENGIVCSAFNAADWNYPTWEVTPGVFEPLVNDVNITGFTSCSVVGSFLRLGVSGTMPGVTGGDTIGNTLADRTPPSYNYTNNINAISDLLGNNMVTTAPTFKNIDDGAPPVPISAVYKSYDGSNFKISIDATKHNDYGLAYPVTYEFAIPATPNSGLEAYKRYAIADAWTQIIEKTPADFFNGIEAVRFDYAADKAYVSVAFGASSDNIFLKITNSGSGDADVSATYLGISKHYDNRDVAVVASADDWESTHEPDFITVSNLFRANNMWLTVGIIPNYQGVNPLTAPEWAAIQAQLDAGNIEPACHGYTHSAFFDNYNYASEIGNCKTVILNNLEMPALNKKGSSEYLPAYIEPFGVTNPDARQKVGEYKFLADRTYTLYNNQYAEWDRINDTFKKSFMTLELSFPGSSDSLFYEPYIDGIVAAHGVIHLLMHPYDPYSAGPINYVKNKNNYWYAGFGHLYMYRYVAVRGDINVVAMDNQVDIVKISMSYDTGLDCTFNAGDWSFPNAGTVNITGSSACSTVANSLDLSVTGTLADVTNGPSAPVVRYTNNADRVVDGAGNALATYASLTVTDGIDPILVYGGGGYGPIPEPVIPPAVPPDGSNLVLHDPAPAEALPAGVAVGDLIKAPFITTVYFIDQDNRRHAFPNEPTYFSYFASFKGIKTIPLSTMALIPIGRNVTVRPGTWLVKIQTDPKVYAVEAYGVLKYVSTADIASKLYGANWATRIIDISPAFFVDYQVGAPITTLTHPTESLIRYQNDAKVYHVAQGKKQWISSAVFTNNIFQNKFILDNFDQAISYPDGLDLVAQKIEDIFSIR